MQTPELFSLTLDDDFFEIINQFSQNPAHYGYMLNYQFTHPDGNSGLTARDVKVNRVRYRQDGFEYVMDIEANDPALTRSIRFGHFTIQNVLQNNIIEEGSFFLVTIVTTTDQADLEISPEKYSEFTYIIRSHLAVPPAVEPPPPTSTNNNLNETYAALASMQNAVNVPAPVPAAAVPVPVPEPIENNENNAPYEPVNLPLPPTNPNGSTRRRKRRNGTKRRRGATRQRRSKN